MWNGSNDPGIQRRPQLMRSVPSVESFHECDHGSAVTLRLDDLPALPGRPTALRIRARRPSPGSPASSASQPSNLYGGSTRTRSTSGLPAIQRVTSPATTTARSVPRSKVCRLALIVATARLGRLDERGRRRTPGERLDSHGSAAGEEIGDPGLAQIETNIEHVEDGLAHHVARRPRGCAWRSVQTSPSPQPPDDAHDTHATEPTPEASTVVADGRR